MFLKDSAMESAIFVTWRKGVRFLDKNCFLVDLAGSQYFFKYSEHVVKPRCFGRPL